MVQNISVAIAVIVAFYLIIRFILKKLAGNGEINPCQGCSGCGMGTGPQGKQGCENFLEEFDKPKFTKKENKGI